MLTLFIAVWGGICPAEVDDGLKERILSAVEGALRQKTLQSGTLDLYDKAGDKVRNLRLLEKNEDISDDKGAYFLILDYRDIHEGDIAKIEFKVIEDGEVLTVEEIRIKDIQKPMRKESLADKEYTDEEIQAFMREYIAKQTQFTDGKLMLFDEDNQKMRHLGLKELKPEVRRMGVFYSSSAQFVEADSGDILAIDISVENQNGLLKVQALRVRDVRKNE
jgi:hypothetical protein